MAPHHAKAKRKCPRRCVFGSDMAHLLSCGESCIKTRVSAFLIKRVVLERDTTGHFATAKQGTPRIAQAQWKFSLGQVVVTPDALEVLRLAGQTPAKFLKRRDTPNR